MTFNSHKTKQSSAMLLCFFIFQLSGVFAQSGLDTLLRDSFPRFNELSGQILLVDKNNSQERIKFGYPNHFFQNDWHKDMMMDIGNLSSIYTYHVFDSLEATKLVKRTDLITKYILDFPLKDATISDLLNHRIQFENQYVTIYHKNLYRGETPDRDGEINMEEIIDLYNSMDLTMGEESYTNISMIYLARILEVITFQPLGELVFQLTKGQVAYNTSGLSAQGHVFLFNGQTAACNSLKEMGMPYVDMTYGHSGFFANPKKVILDYQQSPYKKYLPKISGRPGFHVEVLELNDKKSAFIFLNQVSQFENLEKDLRTFIRSVLPE